MALNAEDAVRGHNGNEDRANTYKECVHAPRHTPRLRATDATVTKLRRIVLCMSNTVIGKAPACLLFNHEQLRLQGMNVPLVCGFHSIHFRAAVDFPCTRGRVRDASRPSLHEWPRTAAFATYTAGEAGQGAEQYAVAWGLTCIEPGSLFRVQRRECVSLRSTALASCRGFTSEDAGALHPSSYTGRPPETKEKAATPPSHLYSRCTSFLF